MRAANRATTVGIRKLRKALPAATDAHEHNIRNQARGQKTRSGKVRRERITVSPSLVPAYAQHGCETLAAQAVTLVRRTTLGKGEFLPLVL